MAILGPGINAGFKGGAGRGRFGNKSSVRVIGLSKLQSEFKRMAPEYDKKLERFIWIAAKQIAERANRDVPIDTGRLNRSIKITRWTRSAEVIVAAPYAAYVEGRDSKGTPMGRTPQPFFFKHVKPAMDQLNKNILRTKI